MTALDRIVKPSETLHELDIEEVGGKKSSKAGTKKETSSEA